MALSTAELRIIVTLLGKYLENEEPKSEKMIIFLTILRNKLLSKLK